MKYAPKTSRMPQTQLVAVLVDESSPTEPTFAETYRANYTSVYRFLLGLTSSHDDAEELTADTFERAFRSWSEVPATPLPWLLLTARRLATDRWRRARRFIASIVGMRGVVDADATVRAAEFWMWFASLTKVLTPRQKEVLVLRYQADLADSDISSIMGISESGVRSLTARALDVLRSHPELLQ